MYSFRDDYSEGVHPAILDAIIKNNSGQAVPYEEDEFCQQAHNNIRAAFGLGASDIHFLPSGTAANTVGLSAMLKPYEGVLAPSTGHINHHETGALEAVGHKIITVEAPSGKLTPELLEQGFGRYEDDHTIMPKVVYITQATELGTVYTKAELEALIDFSRAKGLYTFLDGARLANAIASPASDLSMKTFGSLDLDAFYIGGVKNGGMYGEAVVINNDAFKPHFRALMKQKNTMMSKGRFLGSQYSRFFEEDNLWLQNAKRANSLAQTLYKGLIDLGGEFLQRPQANQIFLILDNSSIAELAKNYTFVTWGKYDETRSIIRLVCSWATNSDEITKFIESAAAILEG